MICLHHGGFANFCSLTFGSDVSVIRNNFVLFFVSMMESNFGGYCDNRIGLSWFDKYVLSDEQIREGKTQNVRQTTNFGLQCDTGRENGHGPVSVELRVVGKELVSRTLSRSASGFCPQNMGDCCQCANCQPCVWNASLPRKSQTRSRRRDITLIFTQSEAVKMLTQPPRVFPSWRLISNRE